MSGVQVHIQICGSLTFLAAPRGLDFLDFGVGSFLGIHRSLLETPKKGTIEQNAASCLPKFSE
jgi:hypothetical protein